MGGGRQKGENAIAATNDESKNGFGEPLRGNRGRTDRIVEEARPLRRSFETPPNQSDRINANVPDNVAQAEGVSKGAYATMMSHLEMPKKAQLPFLILVVLCIIFLAIIICLAALWPQTPYYAKLNDCTDKECLDASKQMLIWANMSVDPCKDPHLWACGKFNEEYSKHSFYGYNKGEWNFKAYQEYKEIRELDQFISQLPSSALSYSAPSILKGLYKSCRDMETLDKAQAEFLLKKAINSLAQYDKLGGSSQVSDEGVAPVQSVIGSVSSSSSASSSSISNANFINTGDTGSVTVSPGVTRGHYLPPSK